MRIQIGDINYLSRIIRKDKTKIPRTAMNIIIICRKDDRTASKLPLSQ